MAEEIHKAESHIAPSVPLLRTEHGQPRIVTSSRYINEQKERDFEMPRWLCVCDQMYLDDAIYNSIDYTNLHVSNSLYSGEFVPRSDTKRSRDAAELLNYCIRNMSYGNWWESAYNACSDLQYGFSLQNIVVEKKGYGQYSRAWTLRKLSPRDQKGVAGWVWNEENTEVLGYIQHPNITQTKILAGKFQPFVNFTQLSSFTDSKYPVLWNEQILHFRYNPRNNNPQGDSPLIHIYQTWKEKELVSRYEVIGVSKDLGGALVVRVPPELMEKAARPDLYPNEYQEYLDLQKDAADLHAGESTYVVLSSELNEDGKTFLYDITMKGVDGGGKMYNTSDIIEQKKKSIYNAFGTGFMLLGQDQTGSYSLASSAMSTHAHYVERNIIQKCVVLDHQLAPRLLAINGIHLNYKDMPYFEPADPTDFDYDVLSKFIQRTKSVGGLPKDVLKHMLKKAKLPAEGVDELDFESKGTSRAGESVGASGTNGSQAGGANSALNSENVAKAANIEDYIFEREDKDEIVLINKETGEPYFMRKDV